MTDPETEACAIGVAIETIGFQDEQPIAAIFIGVKDQKNTVGIYVSEHEIAVGEQLVYEAEDRGILAPEAKAQEPAKANT